jgi:peptidoglycan hydrolase-like protein with peptidoglycan-binding domain
MERTFFGPGLCGEIAKQIQNALLTAGFDPGGTDGFYGNNTAKAIRAFQQSKEYPVTGLVDEATWKALVKNVNVPPTVQRCLSLTAAIEGHGYTLALGNWDNAWLTWGIIGFTMKHGEVQAIVGNVNQTAPDLVRQDFGNNTDKRNWHKPLSKTILDWLPAKILKAIRLCAWRRQGTFWK